MGREGDVGIGDDPRVRLHLTHAYHSEDARALHLQPDLLVRLGFGGDDVLRCELLLVRIALLRRRRPRPRSSMGIHHCWTVDRHRHRGIRAETTVHIDQIVRSIPFIRLVNLR